MFIYHSRKDGEFQTLDLFLEVWLEYSRTLGNTAQRYFLQNKGCVNSSQPFAGKELQVNGNEFQGVFLTRTGVSADAFPVPDESGYWQVWRSPAGIFLVQPLDQQKQPVGNVFPLEEDRFALLLVAASHSGSPLKADAPDLLMLWYEAARKEADSPEPPAIAGSVPTPPKTPGVLLPPGTFLSGKTPVETDEDRYGLPLSLRTRLREGLIRLRDEQKNQHTDVLERLLSGTERSEEKGGADWRKAATFTELGLVLRRDRLYELALLCHERALELSPGDERILFNIARTEFEMGHTEESRRHLRQILEINPEFTVAQDFLRFLEGGNAL